MEYANLFIFYKFFYQKSAVMIRIGAFFIFMLLILLSLSNIWLLKFVFLLFSLFLINEVFLIFKVFRAKPDNMAFQAKESSADLLTIPAWRIYELSNDGYDLANRVSQTPSGQFIIDKIGSQFSLFQSSLTKEQVLGMAFELDRNIKADYIHEVDLFIAYLLLTEEKSKLIEKSDLEIQNMMHLLYWARKKFFTQREDFFDTTFAGGGIFDFFIFGWDAETKKYAADFTALVLADKFPPSVVGRTKEFEKMLTVLEKNKTNNLLLVGEPGTGRTSLVSYFAYEAHYGHVPPKLSYRKVYELYVDRLMAGAQTQGELEARIVDLFSDIRYSGDVLVFIQNLETILGEGGHHFDISGSLFQYLEDGAVQIIATTTLSSYKMYLENKEFVKKFFEVVVLEEPNSANALSMIFEKIPEIEEKHGVSFSYSAVVSSVELSSSYVVDRFLPGKAIDLLENTAAQAEVKGKHRLEKQDLVKTIEERTNIVIAEPSEKERGILLHLEDEIHKRIIDQEEAVGAVANAVRRLRSGFSDKKRPVSVFLFLGPTGVGKTETAKALAAIYYGDEKRMIRVDMSEYQNQDSIKRFLGSMPGENYLPSEFIEQVRSHPFSLILLDEFEKAHPRILDVFLQVFDDGRLTDNLGRSVSFTNTIIIATSNAGSEQIREYMQKGGKIESAKPAILDYLEKKEMFRPELLNRFDEIVLFKPLGPEEINAIAKLILSSVLKLQEEKKIYIAYDDSLVQKVVKEAYDLDFGARNVRRYVETQVVDFLSRQILEGKISRGAHVKLTVNPGTGQIELLN